MLKLTDVLPILVFDAVRVAVARAGLVDVVLENRCVQHSEGDDPESTDDTVDWREGDLGFPEGRIDKSVQYGYHDDDCEGIEVLHEIIRDAVTAHLIGWRMAFVRSNVSRW